MDFAKKTYLASLNSDVDKLDIGKLKNIPSNLSNFKNKVDRLDVGSCLGKLSDALKNDVIKKDDERLKRLCEAEKAVSSKSRGFLPKNFWSYD